MRSAFARFINLITRFIALVLATLFVVTAVAVLPLFNVGWHLFSSPVYKRALASQDVYARLPALAAEQLDLQLHYAGPSLEEGGEAEESTAEPGSGPPPAFNNLTQADWEQFLTLLLPADWLQTQTESALDQAFAILDSTDSSAKVTISLVELKTHVAGEAGVNAFLQLVRAQPPCTQAELKAWMARELTDLPTCRPPDEVLAAATPQIQATLSEAIVQIPDEADLTQISRSEGESESGEVPGESAPDPRQVFQLTRLGLRLSPLIPVVLLLLVALFAVRSRKGLLRWWGIPLLVVGLVGLVLAGAFLPVMTFAYVTYAADRVPPYLSDGLVQAGLDVVWHVVRTLAAWIGGEALLIGLAGLAMLVAKGVPSSRDILP